MNFRKICPICLAVVIAWATALILKWAGFKIDNLILGILMGASVGAAATKYGQNMVWKICFVLLGMPAIWFLINNQFIPAIILFVLLALLTIYFNSKLNKKGEPQADKFKDCC